MAKTIHIYTDASSKDTTRFPQGVQRTIKVGVIVINSNIVDIYYNRKEKFINSYIAEQQAIIESIGYVKAKYSYNNIIIHTDAFYNLKNNFLQKLIKNGFKINYVKGHCPNRNGFKYKFNCLADWLTRRNLNDGWRNYYYRHLLGWKTLNF